jgi:RimJ/RimL family protein N-acetyltransferase
MGLPARPPETVQDGDLSLRLVSEEDWPLQQALSNVDDVVRWTTVPDGLSMQAAKERARGAHSRWLAGVGAQYVVERQGIACGEVGIAAVDGGAEVFYALLPAARGRGIATQSVTLLVHWAKSVGIGEVVLRTFPDNLASQQTAARCGFVPTGDAVGLVKGVPTRLLRWSHRDEASAPESAD